MAGVIVVLHPSDELYGADRVLLSVVQDLRGRSEVEVWLPTDVDYPQRALSAELDRRGIRVRHTDLPVLRRSYANARSLRAVLGRVGTVAQALRAARPDSLYVNTSALAPAIPVAAALRIPTTVHVHETWGDLERRVLTRLCTPADTVVTVGDATRSALPEVLRRRAVVRRHTVDAEVVEADEVARIRGLIAPHPGDFAVLYAGRWTPGKGIAELLTAFAAVDDPHLRLVLLGGPPPSGEGVDAQGLAAANGISDRVTLVGEVTDVWPYIYAADAVAVPSVKPESYPTIALEAIAAGRPVMASDIGGLPEIVRPGRGWLIAPGDIDAWAAGLIAARTRSATMSP
jgi:glycosyltransferase involved in cell wall biosynthesis